MVMQTALLMARHLAYLSVEMMAMMMVMQMVYLMEQSSANSLDKMMEPLLALLREVRLADLSAEMTVSQKDLLTENR